MKWIKVAWDLPPEMEDVLVLQKNGIMHVAHWAPEHPPHSEWRAFFSEEERIMSVELYEITHWMPLPKLPEK